MVIPIVYNSVEIYCALDSQFSSRIKQRINRCDQAVQQGASDIGTLSMSVWAWKFALIYVTRAACISVYKSRGCTSNSLPCDGILKFKDFIIISRFNIIAEFSKFTFVATLLADSVIPGDSYFIEHIDVLF